MIDSETIMWPDETVPTPLIGRKHRYLSQTRNTRMDSERIRRRRLLAAPIHLIEASWNMTGDSFDAFKEFYDITLENGEQLFGMITYDPHPNTEFLIEVTRLLGFRERYEFTPSDNNFSVSALLEVIWESTQEVTNPNSPIPELEYEFTSECQDEVRCFFTIPEGDAGEYTLQIASSIEGPWGDHVYTSLTGEEEVALRKDVYLNNDYRGEAWFRVLKPTGAMHRRPVNIPASILEPPTIEITNLEVSTREMRSDEGFVLPYSAQENAWISQDDTYIVPRGRLEHSEVRASWNSLHEIVSLSGEAGAVHTFSRNGADPTISTLMPSLNGQAMNAFVHNTDFGLMIKARSFKDGCRSPVTCILVDKKITGMENWFRADGIGNAVTGSCDYPHPDTGSESGGSCNNNFGSPEAFDEYMGGYVQSVAAASNNDVNIYLYSVSHVDFNQWYGGYIGRGVSASYFEHQDSYLYRLLSLWDPTRESFLFGEIEIVHGEDGVGSPIGSLTAIHETGQTIAGSGGSNAVFEASLTNYINNFIVLWSETYQTMSVSELNAILTLHHDYISPYESGYPTPDVPEEPEEPVVPDEDLDIYWDPFEAYELTDDATLITMNAESGWDGAWEIIDLDPTFNYEDFEEYDDGVVPDTVDTDSNEDQILDSGSGWDGPWYFETNAYGIIYVDDFEDYADGTITIFVNLNSGHIENFLEDSEPAWDGGWSAQNEPGGLETFESYSDATLPEGETALDDGDGVGWDGPWYVESIDVVSFSAVKLLMGFEGVDGSTTFDDESNSNHTVTPSGNSQIDTAQFKYGASSGLFDGTGDYLTIPNHADFDFTSQFTLECWFRMNAHPANSSRLMLLGKTQAAFTSGMYMALRRDTDTSQLTRLQCLLGSGTTLLGTTVLNTGQWYHAAVTWDGSVLRLFIDGVLENSNSSPTLANNSDDFVIGRWPGSTTRDMNGWIDEIRFSAKCVYPAAFTPPAAAFPRS